jgi:hypothetical protein
LLALLLTPALVENTRKPPALYGLRTIYDENEFLAENLAPVVAFAWANRLSFQLLNKHKSTTPYLPKNPFTSEQKYPCSSNWYWPRILKIYQPLFGQNRITFDI